MNFLFPFTSMARAALATLWGHRVVVALLLVVAVFAVEFYALKLPQAQAAYTIANSARFISGNSDSLSRTPGSAGSATTFTLSTWVKLANVTLECPLLSANQATDRDEIKIRSDGFFDLRRAQTFLLRSNAVFRDPAQWAHFVFVADTNNATESDRYRMYVDGKRITSFSTATYPAQGNQFAYFNTAVIHYIGREANTAGPNFCDGYMSDAYFVDGQALTPSSFGEYDTSGYWRPKTYSGTYGTNGFHLPLMGTSTAAGIGIDTSGNNNTWTVNNIATTDFVKDSPTNSFATLNPLDKSGTIVFSEGNTKASCAATCYLMGTAIPSTGKWVWEYRLTSGAGLDSGLGRLDVAITSRTQESANVVDTRDNNTTVFVEGVQNTGQWSTTYGTAWVQVLVDMDAGTIQYKTASDDTDALSFNKNRAWGVWAELNGDAGEWNFGASGTWNVATPPSGYKALSTANLAAPAVVQPNLYFDAKTYTGSGAATSTWSGFVGFQPDIVWLKDRTSANAHGIFDSSRTLIPAWASNATNAEGGAGGTALTGFLSNGFSLGASSTVNTSGDNFISWLWKESVTAGMDIVTYTGTGANRTISHSLGAVPDMMIVKRRDSTGNPTVYHGSLTASTTQILLLNTTAAVATDATAWNSTAPTASVFSLGTNVDVNASAGTYVSYLFNEVEGFSKFGSYTGNGSADGPFVYTGFKPRYVLIKNITTASTNWIVHDSARNPYNLSANRLMVNVTDAEAADNGLDSLSNGFKLRSTNGSTNTSGDTYIYAAFADVPFKYSAASAASAASVASSFVQAIAFLMGMTF